MKLKNIKGGMLLLIFLLIAVNFLASIYHARIDLTAEKRFTLSSPTIRLLDTLKGKLSIEVFLKGNYPSGFKKLGNATNELLAEFREIAGQKLQFRFISPDETMPGTEITFGDTLSGMGMYPINLTSQLKEGQQQQLVYPFALVHYNDATLPVSLYQGKTPLINFQELNSAEAMLEYRFADAIYKLSRTTKPLVAFATGNGEPMDISVYDMVENVLKPNYNLVTFNLAAQPSVPAEINTIVIVKPTAVFTDIQKLKLDQFVMRGGHLLMFIDRLNAEMDSLQVKNEVIAFDRELQLNDLLFKYGARINPDLVMDLQCDYLPFDVNGNGQFELLPWNYFPVLEAGGNNAVTKNLGFIAGRFVNSIDTVEAENIKKTILLSSSANSRKIQTPALISGRENVNAPEDAKFNIQHIPVAVLLEGSFASLYANRLTQSMNDSLKAAQLSYLPKGKATSKIIVAGDGDMVLNSVMKNQPMPMGMNPFTFGSQREFPFANKDFFISCLEYLVNESGLNEAKNKEYVVRLLDTKKVNENKLKLQLINIVLPVALMLIFGFLFQIIRRKKYSR